jgi:ABC-type sugar transport system ATPase subunit
MSLLIVRGISKQTGSDFVLKDIHFNQQKYQKIAIAGETGSGKSTLLKIIAGFIQPEAGEVLFENERVLGPDEKLIPGHKSIAYLSQYFELRNNYRVEELLEMANKITNEEADTIFEICRIKHLLKRKTDQLSGGEKQRIAAAQLLITSPQLLLLDEPYSNLDMVHKKILKSVIHDISEKLKISCIMISHDPSDTLSWADEVLVMQDGAVIQRGTPAQVYNQPMNEYVAGLFGNFNLLNNNLAKAFGRPVGADQLDKDLFTRTEDFSITSDEKEAPMGEVNKVHFFGGYYEIEVLLEDGRIVVRTTQNALTKGDLVYVSLNKKNNWFV